MLDFLLIELVRHFFQDRLYKISQLETSYPQIARNFLISSLVIFMIGFLFEHLLLQIPASVDPAATEYLYSLLYEKIAALTTLFSAGIILSSFSS